MKTSEIPEGYEFAGNYSFEVKIPLKYIFMRINRILNINKPVKNKALRKKVLSQLFVNKWI